MTVVKLSNADFLSFYQMWDEEDFANFPDQDYRSGPMYPEEQGSPPSASSSGRNRSATSSTRSQLPRGQGNGNPQAAANHAEEPTVVYTLFVNHLTLNTCEVCRSISLINAT